MTRSLPLGQRLIQRGYIDSWQLQSALGHQQRWGGHLGEVISELRFMAENVVMTEVARQLGVSYADVAHVEISSAVMRLVPERLLRSHKILPLRLAAPTARRRLVVATAEPQDLATLDEIAFACGLPVEPVLATRRAIEIALEHHLGPRSAPPDRTVELPVGPAGPMHLLSTAETIDEMQPAWAA